MASLSCLGKLFTAIMNTRLLLIMFNLLSETQAGFRKALNTLDNVFVVSCLIYYTLNNSSNMYCTCIDFTKTFGTV